MALIRSFTGDDIGAELFPAITRGLYRDPLDALREYVQNAIDAGAKNIRISLLKDVVSVQDDGQGMSRSAADRAIRLGISDKNPLTDVGFRGIGIYSSYDLCNKLEVYTKAKRKDEYTCITVDFAAIRKLLEREVKKRAEGVSSELHLEELLSERVSVEACEDPPDLGTSGTLVMLTGVRDLFSSVLSSRSDVEHYLQNVIPLPFHPDFEFGPEIRRRLTSADYRLVNEITLVVNGRESKLYQAYTGEMFTHGGEVRPEFYEVKLPGSRGAKFGFAWVCYNDANKVLGVKELRGLLIKKYGFSISNREYLEPLFTKPPIARRITGEIIVQDADLIPNAARTDFEANQARTDFRRALASLVADVTKRGMELQDHWRALELLQRAQERLPGIHDEIASSQRDTDSLLSLNVELSGIKDDIAAYARVLQKAHTEEHRDVLQSIDEGTAAIRKLLSRRRTHHREKHVQRAVEKKQAAPSAGQTPHAADRPESLVELMDDIGVALDEPLRSALSYIDDNLIRPNVRPEQYESDLLQLRSFLEELS